ncbi:MAG TPA: hypothetical protein ENI61_04260 [Ignavibacteria bacterium]|nr:hypothetical protein [Ignavibacteria bacterium]
MYTIKKPTVLEKQVANYLAVILDKKNHSRSFKSLIKELGINTDLDLKEAVFLIKQKQSKFSVSERNCLIALYNSQKYLENKKCKHKDCKTAQCECVDK